MSNPNFNPVTSSDDIYLGQDMDKCLTDEVNSKAPAEHEHSGYASSAHTHNETYSPLTHTHSNKADLVNGKVPISQIPDDLKEIRIASNIAARDAMTGLFEGLSVYVVDATADSTVTSGGAWYLYDGTNWIKTAEAESMDAVLQWANVLGKPETFPPATHAHTAADVGAMSNVLQFTNDTGGVEYFYGENSGKNLLTEIASWEQGFHTAYSIEGTSGNPKTTESWRILCHKTSGTIGWIIAFGSSGSVYTNYQANANTFKGWECIYNAQGEPLWTGCHFVTNTQTITPSKKLSECRNGWILVWSDYDPDTSASTDGDFCMCPTMRTHCTCSVHEAPFPPHQTP